MKKLLTLVLALVLALCAFTGCKNDNADDNADGYVPDITVGLITLHDDLSTYDANFINAFKQAGKDLGLSEDRIKIKTGIPEGTECYTAAKNLVEEGCDVIFADSFGHESYVLQAAREYPNVQFCHATGTRAQEAGLANFHNAFASIYEGRYLAGVVAGLKLNEMIDSGKITAAQAKMGYVGAFTYAEVISGYTSFYLGAKSVCPSVTMDVKFTGSWYHEIGEKTTANALIDGGCVLISQHADSMGAPNACEEKNVPNVSYNGSTGIACPNTFLVSSKINWTPYFRYMIMSVANGGAIEDDYVGTLLSDSVQLTELGSAVAKGTATKLEEVKKRLIAGTEKVFDINKFTVDGRKVESLQIAALNNAEVIVNGQFCESLYRSAPYFELNIDGITLINRIYDAADSPFKD